VLLLIDATMLPAKKEGASEDLLGALVFLRYLWK